MLCGIVLVASPSLHLEASLLLQSGYFKSVEKFIKASEDQLEFETQDDLRETPLMVAVRAGVSNMETISIILELGGKVFAFTY